MYIKVQAYSNIAGICGKHILEYPGFDTKDVLFSINLAVHSFFKFCRLLLSSDWWLIQQSSQSEVPKILKSYDFTSFFNVLHIYILSGIPESWAKCFLITKTHATRLIPNYVLDFDRWESIYGFIIDVRMRT